MAIAPLTLSDKSRRTTEPPITWLIQSALDNPDLISLAAGLVDQQSLPIQEVANAVSELAAAPNVGKAALQYGTTRGYGPLRQRLLRHIAALDGIDASAYGLTENEVIVTTGSQQLLYLLSEVLLNPGDYVITEAPSYFVHHGVLTSHGAKVLAVPMDDDGLDIDALTELLKKLESRGELHRVKLLYTCDYYQNPSGLTLSLQRRRQILEVVRRFSRSHRILVLEDAAYRELGFAGQSLPSIKSFERDNAQVIYAGTFSKPCAPGLKTGYAMLPTELLKPLLELKGVHDFGSSNFNQVVIERFMASGGYGRHVRGLQELYCAKRDTILAALDDEFGDWPEVRWTRPDGGMFLWLTFPDDVDTGAGGPLLAAAMKEGMLYVPGEFCHVPHEDGHVRRNEMRLCYGVEPPDRIREAVRRLRKAARLVQGVLV